jgi:hypothetical protein
MMDSSAGCHDPCNASDNNFSRPSVIFEMAECTTMGCNPSAMRALTMSAIFFQFAGVETLVPPNFRTTALVNVGEVLLFELFIVGKTEVFMKSLVMQCKSVAKKNGAVVAPFSVADRLMLK